MLRPRQRLQTHGHGANITGRLRIGECWVLGDKRRFSKATSSVVFFLKFEEEVKLGARKALAPIQNICISQRQALLSNLEMGSLVSGIPFPMSFFRQHRKDWVSYSLNLYSTQIRRYLALYPVSRTGWGGLFRIGAIV